MVAYALGGERLAQTHGLETGPRHVLYADGPALGRLAQEQRGQRRCDEVVLSRQKAERRDPLAGERLGLAGGLPAA